MQRMRAAALPTRADGQRFEAERNGNIGVGRGALHARAIAELRIYGADDLQHARIVLQVARRTIPDGLDLSLERLLAGVRRARLVDSVVHRLAQGFLEPIDLLRR